MRSLRHSWAASAAVTAFMAWQTRRLATKTAALVDSAQVEAAATVELASKAKKDRELSWSPYLVRSTAHTGIGPPENISGQRAPELQQVTLNNVGRGPALKCSYVAFLPTELNVWSYAELPALVSGQQDQPMCKRGDGPSPLYLVDQMPHDDGWQPTYAALFCEVLDALGRELVVPLKKCEKVGAIEKADNLFKFFLNLTPCRCLPRDERHVTRGSSTEGYIRVLLRVP